MPEEPKRLSPRLDEREALHRCGWPDCRAACCVYGTWVGEGEVADILAHADLVAPLMASERRDPPGWFSEIREPDEYTPRGTVLHTTVVEDPSHYGGSACIFLLEDYRCALQAAGQAAGMHPWRLKPFYCVLHPLDLDEQGRITLDETGLLVVEPASCLRKGDKGVRLRDLFAEELEFLTKDRRS
jgi:hypothetical protein